MKKLFALFLALMLVLSMSSVALAAEIEMDTKVVVPKKYEVKHGTAPAETFTYEFTGQSYKNSAGEIVANATIPEIADVTINFEAISATEEKTVEVPINADDYELGVYTYEVSENIENGNTAGIGYSTEKLYLVLTILRDENSDKHYVAAMHYQSATGDDKTTGFTNTYDSGSLSVTKKISGNMANMDKKFAFTITFNAPTNKVVKSTITVTKPDGATEDITFATGENTRVYNISLGHGETVKFENLPDGVTYTISEANENYTKVDETYSDTAETKTINGGDNDTYSVTNKLEDVNIDTGITTDSLPYVLLMGMALVGIALMLKRRAAHND